MNVFWRDEPLDQREQDLLAALLVAHEKCVFRDNVSTHAVAGAAIGSGDYGKAIASGILGIGYLHAPLAQTMELLSHPAPCELVEIALAEGRKIPGWGSSFGKDSIFDEVEELLRGGYGIADKIRAVTETFAHHGKDIHPNPGCYSAAVALILKMPPSVAPWIFIQGRLDGWSKVFLNNYKPDAMLWD